MYVCTYYEQYCILLRYISYNIHMYIHIQYVHPHSMQEMNHMQEMNYIVIFFFNEKNRFRNFHPYPIAEKSLYCSVDASHFGHLQLQNAASYAIFYASTV